MSRRSALTIFLLLSGLGTSIYGIKDFWTAIRSTQWPSITAEVTRSELVIGSSGSGMRRGRTYTPAIEYRFAISGIEYAGTRVSFRDHLGRTRHDAQTIVQRYPMRAIIQIHYDPSKPERCVIEPGAGIDTFAVSGLGIVLGAAGMYLFLRKPTDTETA